VSPADRHHEPSPIVAAFDVDGTLTTRDCVVPFLRLVGGTGRLTGGLALAAGRVVPALARRDRDALKAESARVVFTGRAEHDVEAAGASFAARIEQAWLRRDTLTRMHWHRIAGHRVVLVSASFGAYLRPLGRRLVTDGVLATELEIDDTGRCTGALLGGNCRGVEKVTRLHAWLDEHHGGRSAVELWAYGDSSGDRHLLADADHGVWARETLEPSP
jgi:phosphatidylglycerophosphatase C